MAKLYDFSADTGIVMPDTDDVRDGIVKDFKGDESGNNGIFGPNCDTSEETHIGRFIDEITELVVQTTGVNAQNANQFNIDYATGTFLDNHGASVGVARDGRSRTVVPVKLTSAGKGTVRAGTVFSSDDDYEFALVSDVELGDANAVVEGGKTTYSSTGTAKAVEYGRIYCPAGTLNNVKTLVSVGLTGLSVTNEYGETELGRDEETDDHYRRRIKAATFTGAGSVSAILNALYGVVNADDGMPSVSDAVVLENGLSYPVVKSGIAVPGHSIFVCALGGDDNDVAKAIYGSKTAGAGYTRTTVISAMQDAEHLRHVTVEGDDVWFFRPLQRGLTVNVTADVSSYTGTNAKNVVMDAVKEYIADVGIGAEITDGTVVSAIVGRVGASIRITGLSLSYAGQAVQRVRLSAGESFTTNTAGSGPVLVVNTTLVG